MQQKRVRGKDAKGKRIDFKCVSREARDVVFVDAHDGQEVGFIHAQDIDVWKEFEGGFARFEHDGIFCSAEVMADGVWVEKVWVDEIEAGHSGRVVEAWWARFKRGW